MGLTTNLSKLEQALVGCSSEYCPDSAQQNLAAALLAVVADFLDAAPSQTPLVRIVEPLLNHFPAGAFTRNDLQGLVKIAGRCESSILRTPAAEIARCLRQASARLLGASNRPRDEPETFKTAHLHHQVGKSLSAQRRSLVRFLLAQEDHKGSERAVVAHLWPADGKKKALPAAARNRLYKLVHDTNESLLELDGATWKIRRPAAGSLQLVRLGL